MKIIDVKGKKCPMPLIETKKALKELGHDESLKVILDSETSVQNVMRYLKDNGVSAEQHKKGNEFEILVNKSGQIGELTEVDPYCETLHLSIKAMLWFLQKTASAKATMNWALSWREVC